MSDNATGLKTTMTRRVAKLGGVRHTEGSDFLSAHIQEMIDGAVQYVKVPMGPCAARPADTFCDGVYEYVHGLLSLVLCVDRFQVLGHSNKIIGSSGMGLISTWGAGLR